jgi:hypothetical protein
MIRDIIEEIKLKKVSNLIEIIQLKDINSKIEAFNKLEKMKITKEIGLFLIESAKFDYGIKDGNGGINGSLISLCFKEYYDEYTPEFKKLYKYLDDDAKNKLVYLLSTTDNESALKLYVDLVIKNYSESDFIPISNLYERAYLYDILFPKLFKALKFKSIKNNLLILLNDYLNAGVVREEDLKKNKKIIIDAISRVFEEALKFDKFTNTTKALQNNDYFDIRFFLELSVNIEFYVSNRKTDGLLKKLFDRNDNQLKLFILDNYLRKGKDISKLKLEPIAKDEACRYPLFDMLNIYAKANYMPKKYLEQKLLAKSDFYINFMLSTKYEEAPKNYKFLEKRKVDNYTYFIFKFKHSYTYDNSASDFATNYIMHQSGLDKYNNKTVTKEFIGISGGYIADEEPSTLAFNHNRLLCKVIPEKDKEKEVIDSLIEDITKDVENYKKELFNSNKIKNKKNKDLNKKVKKIKKQAKKELKKQEKNTKEKPKKNKEKKVKEKKVKKEKEILENKEVLDNNEILESNIDLEKNKKVKKHRFHFSYILIFLFFVFIVLLVLCVLYTYDTDLIKIKVNKTDYVSSAISNTDSFKEIDGHDIFNQEESEYYVLLYKKDSKEKNTYYTYINEYLKNNATVYYVNLNDKKNKFLYSNNDLNFVLTKDRFLKVTDKDFEYYIDGKANILTEMKNQINTYNKNSEESKNE